MFRVVTDIRDYRGNRLLEAGPWHKAENIAEEWAEILRGLGYTVKIERMKGEISGGSSDNDELRDALASMA